jgi:hypothetical protein
VEQVVLADVRPVPRAEGFDSKRVERLAADRLGAGPAQRVGHALGGILRHVEHEARAGEVARPHDPDRSAREVDLQMGFVRFRKRRRAGRPGCLRGPRPEQREHGRVPQSETDRRPDLVVLERLMDQPEPVGFGLDHHDARVHQHAQDRLQRALRAHARGPAALAGTQAVHVVAEHRVQEVLPLGAAHIQRAARERRERRPFATGAVLAPDVRARLDGEAHPVEFTP